MCSKQKSLNFGNYVPNDKVLNKKVPQNPKYKNVKPAVYTGRNVNRQIDELKEKHKNSNQRKNELFKRIKFSAFIRLAVNIAKEHLRNQVKDEENEQAAKSTNNSSKNTLANVLVGIGEIDLKNEKQKPSTISMKRNQCGLYLLLDVRDKEEFLKSHIKTAKHYPAALLSRSIGYETEDLKIYKNKLHHLIILYDEDETIATRVATTLIQREYNNVYMLSGGLVGARDSLPSALIRTVLTSPSSKNALETSSQVQIKEQAENFSEEDVDFILEYVEDFRPKDYSKNYPASVVSSDRSCSHFPQHYTDAAEYKNQQLQGSLTYRKSSAKSIEQAPYNNATYDPDSRLKSGRRTPWK